MANPLSFLHLSLLLSSLKVVLDVAMRAGNSRGTKMTRNAVKTEHGLRLTFRQVRDVLEIIDGPGQESRRVQATRRPNFVVAFPNYVWSMDGNHDLVAYKIIVHGAIDAYSRRFMFLGASDNNRATTVLNLFDEAVEKHGFPALVRADFGGENEDVKHRVDEEYGE